MKKIIVVSGLPGSGKSTLSESIAQALQIPIFSVDPIESSILEAGIARSFETGLHAYIVVKRLGAEQLKLGMSIIIDAVSPVVEARVMWEKLAKGYDAKLIIIECVVDEKLHKKRLKKRVRNLHGIAEITWEDVEVRKKDYVPWTQERLVVDTAKENKKILEEALKYIKKIENQ